MTSDTIVAPSLSSHQDDSIFLYDKVRTTHSERLYLNLIDPSDTTEIKSRIWEYYSLRELIACLSQREGESYKYKRITLQFPDTLVCDSATIVHELQRELGIVPQNNGTANSSDGSQRLWILADTSYSACCVDEVAAEHVNSDLVVHFGDACLNEVDKLPAVFVLGKPQVEINEIVRQFKETYSKDQKIILMSDAPHTYLLHELRKELEDYEIVIADLPRTQNSTIIGYTPNTSNFKKFNRCFDSEIDF